MMTAFKNTLITRRTVKNYRLENGTQPFELMGPMGDLLGPLCRRALLTEAIRRAARDHDMGHNLNALAAANRELESERSDVRNRRSNESSQNDFGCEIYFLIEPDSKEVLVVAKTCQAAYFDALEEFLPLVDHEAPSPRRAASDRVADIRALLDGATLETRALRWSLDEEGQLHLDSAIAENPMLAAQLIPTAQQRATDVLAMIEIDYNTPEWIQNWMRAALPSLVEVVPPLNLGDLGYQPPGRSRL